MKINEGELDRMLSFMLKADRMKEIKRTGWVWAGVKEPEHDGDHSFSVALMSYLIAKRLRLDADKCMRMGLIHDIGEVITGDIPSRADEKMQKVSSQMKKRLGNKSTIKMLSYLDDFNSKEFIRLWKELEEEKTQEAKLVKQIDKLDYIMQISIYSKQIKSDKKFEEFFISAAKKIHSPELRYLFDKIKKKAFAERKIK
ncbi:MAG: HD family hydrolase [Candidatus Micrarchaeota archaeon]|nr:HD family hydrolase [Candidatus Micrarchaeota archaeon]